MRSNAGMAKRQGDVDLRFAQFSATSWHFGLAWWLGTHHFAYNAWLLKMELIECPETYVTNYQSALHNIAETKKISKSHFWNLSCWWIFLCYEIFLFFGWWSDVNLLRNVFSCLAGISDKYSTNLRPTANVQRPCRDPINLLKPTGHVMHHQFNIQQLYALPTLYLCVLYLSENKQRLVSLTA